MYAGCGLVCEAAIGYYFCDELFTRCAVDADSGVWDMEVLEQESWTLMEAAIGNIVLRTLLS